jgi:hypothetical protein
VFCLAESLDLIIVISSKANQKIGHNLYKSGFYVIKVHELIGSFSAVPGGQREKLWQEFLLDPLHQWDHKSEKVTEHENEAIALLVSILLLSLLVAILPWSKLW